MYICVYKLFHDENAPTVAIEVLAEIVLDHVMWQLKEI